MVLLTIGLVIILPLGDSIADRHSANRAADSAALVGAGYCADQLEAVYSRLFDLQMVMDSRLSLATRF